MSPKVRRADTAGATGCTSRDVLPARAGAAEVEAAEADAAGAGGGRGAGEVPGGGGAWS